MLPNTYKQLGYIQSTGTQYINLNKAPTAVGRVTIEFVPMLSSTTQMIIGSRSGSSYIGYLLQLSNNQLSLNMSGVTLSNVNPVTFTVGESYVYDCDLNGGKIMVNDTQYATTSGYNSLSRAYYLFASNDVDGGAITLASVRFKSLKIYNQSGTLTEDYIPAKRLSDGVLGIYDLVNDVFRTNSGTGIFLTGYEVTASGTGGTVTGVGTYGEGETATLTAVPDSGYKFNRWELGGTTYTDNPLTITVNSDMDFIVYFDRSSSCFIKVNGEWKQGTLYRKDTTWKEAEVFVKNGTWKK